MSIGATAAAVIAAGAGNAARRRAPSACLAAGGRRSRSALRCAATSADKIEHDIGDDADDNGIGEGDRLAKGKTKDPATGADNPAGGGPVHSARFRIAFRPRPPPPDLHRRFIGSKSRRDKGVTRFSAAASAGSASSDAEPDRWFPLPILQSPLRLRTGGGPGRALGAAALGSRFRALLSGFCGGLGSIGKAKHGCGFGGPQVGGMGGGVVDWRRLKELNRPDCRDG